MFSKRERTQPIHPRIGAPLAARALLLLAVIGLTAPGPRAEIRWKSGATQTPSTMQPAELGNALTRLADPTRQRRIVIQLDGPLRRGQRDALALSGVRLLGYLGDHAYFATVLSGADPFEFVKVPGTVAIEAVDPANKIHPDLGRGDAPPWSVVAQPTAERPAPVVAVYVLFHRDFDLSAAATVVALHGGTVRSEIEAVNGIVAHVSLDRIAELAAEDDVMYVEPPLPAFQHLNDDNRVRTQADVLNAPPYGLDGSGVSVLVYDAGQVLSHSDLAGRLTIGQSDTGSVSDHATHVACTIGGDDSGGSLSGMAPATDIVSYTFEQAGGLNQGFLYTDPGDLEDDYAEAISLHGADLSNNSIGTNTAPNGFPCSWEGNYGTTGALIDEVVRGALGEPFRVVWANGNERGSGGNCGSTYHTTAPPACAKNHLTVGALNSNDDSVTSFTSWGPCDDGRLKPDVAAPGCQSDDDDGVTSCSSSGGYTVKCGTSMASPTVAGVAALLLQQYRESFPGRPDFRNSLLRAILAHTAVDLGNPGPDYQTGYGSIRARPAVDAIKAERFVEDEVSQGEVYEFTITVLLALDSQVKMTLAWDDPAGTPDVDPVLVNDLDLRVIGPDQQVHHPWTLDPDNPGDPAVQSVRDGVNNIEQVMISNATSGVYRVQVEGVNLAEGAFQPFSLASSHDPEFCEAEPTFAGLTGVTAGQSCGEIELSWAAAQSNCAPAGQIAYNIYRDTTAFFLPGPANLVHERVQATTLTDQGLDPGVTYFYLVRAEDSSSGEDANFVRLSATAPVSPDNSAPLFSGLQTASPGPNCGEVLLEWDAAIESCSGPTIYDVYRSTNPLFAPGPEALVATTFATEFVDTSVTPGTSHSYVVRARDSLGNEDDNFARVAANPTQFDLELFRTEFEPSGAGWAVVEPNDADTGNWQWGDPDGTSYQPDDDATPAGVNCWITGLSGSPSNGDIDGGTTTLLSSPIDLTGASTAEVRYSRWFTNDRGNSPGDPTDMFHLEASDDDGQNWTPLEPAVGAGTPLEWVPVSVPLPVAATNQVRFRFQAADLGDGSVVEAGIDDFEVVDPGQACLQCDGLPAQTLCSIAVDRNGGDIRIDWGAGPVGTRAVVYHIAGCGESEQIRLGSTTDGFFVHESAALSDEEFNYRVTFVDECGNEQAFCGATDCP
jgi:subtilisin family serine protease